MALLAARLALKKSLQLQQQQKAISVVSSSLDLLPPKQQQQQHQQHQQLRWLTSSSSSSSSSSSEEKNSDGRVNEVTVSKGEDDDWKKNRKKSNNSWFPVNLMNKLSSGLWRNKDRGRDLAIPSNLNHLFSSGLGDALMNASDNLNRLIENWALPARLNGQIKENKSHYKLRFEVPGLSKDEVKITIEDGILTIRGEHKEEEDDEGGFYGYYDTSLLLPDDAKVEEIKAEMKDGVLYVTIPRTERKEKDVKEIMID